MQNDFKKMMSCPQLCLVLESIRTGLRNLSTRIQGPSSLIQAALPSILFETPDHYFLQAMKHIQVSI
jgi:hypothetical protein